MIIEMLEAVHHVGSARGISSRGWGEASSSRQARLPLTQATVFLGPSETNLRASTPPIRGDEPRAWAVVCFVDPIVEIAVPRNARNTHADE